MLGDLSYQAACGGVRAFRGTSFSTVLTGGRVVDAGNVVHAPNDKVGGVRRPGQIVDLGAAGPTHVLGSPRLLVLKPFGAKMAALVVFGWHPEDDVAVVSGRCK
jgi:hypothetical protein